MPSIKESAIAYEGGSKTRNIAELEKVSTDLDVKSKTLKNSKGEEFTLEYVEIEGEEFRVPASVLKSLKVILEDNPALKTFRVKKQGADMDTSYTVIPLG